MIRRSLSLIELQATIFSTLGSSGQPLTLAQLPFPITKYRGVDCCQEFLVEGLHCPVNRLYRPSAEKYRHSHLSAFRLSFMENRAPGRQN